MVNGGYANGAGVTPERHSCWMNKDGSRGCQRRPIPIERANQSLLTLGTVTTAVESKVYQRTVDYPDEFHDGFHIWLDTVELVTMR